MVENGFPTGPPDPASPPQSDFSGSIVPWEPTPGEMAAVVSTMTDPYKIIAAMNDTLPMTDLKEKPDKFVDVTIHEATVLQEETGELQSVRRTVLTSEKGVNYAAVSEGVISSIKQISALIGPPPWEPAIKLRMIEKQTRKGWRTYRLIPVK